VGGDLLVDNIDLVPWPGIKPEPPNLPRDSPPRKQTKFWKRLMFGAVNEGMRLSEPTVKIQRKLENKLNLLLYCSPWKKT
jgi:hypothetical protein